MYSRRRRSYTQCNHYNSCGGGAVAVAPAFADADADATGPAKLGTNEVEMESYTERRGMESERGGGKSSGLLWTDRPTVWWKLRRRRQQQLGSHSLLMDVPDWLELILFLALISTRYPQFPG